MKKYIGLVLAVLAGYLVSFAAGANIPESVIITLLYMVLFTQTMPERK